MSIPERRSRTLFVAVPQNCVDLEQVVRYSIRCDPVQFLRHTGIEAAQTGFYVRDADVMHPGHLSARDGGIDVAHDQHQIGTFSKRHALEGVTTPLAGSYRV